MRVLDIKNDFLTSETLARLLGTMPRHTESTVTMCFIRLLYYCTYWGTLWNERDFYKVSCSSKQTAQRVWRYCVFNDILRKTENGYSTLEWMNENGLLITEVAR